jgi:hypothetical protein
MRGFITGILVGIAGVAAAYYFGQDKIFNPEAKGKTRQILANSMTTACAREVKGRAGKIVRKLEAE